MANATNQKIGNSTLLDARVKASFGTKAAFFADSFGNAFAFTAVMSMLSFFWTDVARIPATTASAFLVVCKIWDAVNDPIVGYMSDRTNTKWGRYRPWTFAGVLSAIFGLLMFTIIPGMSEKGVMWFSFSMYFLWVLFNTMWEIPNTSMIGATTTDPTSRVSIVSSRQMGSNIGSLLIAAALLPMVTALGRGSMSKGFFLSMLILEAVAIPLTIWKCAAVKERVMTPVDSAKISESIKCLKGNVPFWLFFTAFFFYGVTSGTTGARMYFWTYNYGDGALMSSNMTIWMGCSAVGAFLLGLVKDKFKSKSKMAVAGFLLRAAADLVAGLININSASSEGTILLYQIVTAVSGFGLGWLLCAMYSIMPDITEYTQWKYGMRISGFITSVLNCAFKISMAVGSALHVYVIGVLGYVPGEAQTASVLAANNWFLNFIPAIVLTVSAIIMSRYKIDNATFDKMVKEIGAASDHAAAAKE